METATQLLPQIVSNQATVEVEALLKNRDIGFLDMRRRAEVKVDVFDFTKCGLAAVKVLDIGDDAIQDERLV